MKKITLTPELLSDDNLNSTQTIILATIHTYINNDVLLMTNQEISNVLNNKFKTDTVKKVIYQLRNLGYISTRRYILSEPEHNKYGNARVITLVTNEVEPVTEEQQQIIDFIAKLEQKYVQDKSFTELIEYCDNLYNNSDNEINYKKYSYTINRLHFKLTKL